MKSNIGGTERIIRILLGAGLLAIGLLAGLATLWSYIAIGAGLVLLATALLNFCPIWALAGVNTCKK
ncbi:MAG TPA: DUF2892 domain-containing protein [Mariprofundaceae bacterium]|nr:DUF2892 domain-containing protein [Mariprofundaceae bacterium]